MCFFLSAADTEEAQNQDRTQEDLGDAIDYCLFHNNQCVSRIVSTFSIHKLSHNFGEIARKYNENSITACIMYYGLPHKNWAIIT